MAPDPNSKEWLCTTKCHPLYSPKLRPAYIAHSDRRFRTPTQSNVTTVNFGSAAAAARFFITAHLKLKSDAVLTPSGTHPERWAWRGRRPWGGCSPGRCSLRCPRRRRGGNIGRRCPAAGTPCAGSPRRWSCRSWTPPAWPGAWPRARRARRRGSARSRPDMVSTCCRRPSGGPSGPAGPGRLQETRGRFILLVETPGVVV